jgi:polysaccharide export outer membrane protein
MTRAVLAALLALCAPAATLAQAPPATRPAAPAAPRAQPQAQATPAPTPSASPAPIAPEYRVGAGDVLEVVVLGNDDLSRTPTVQTGGTVTLPLLGEVAVAGLTVPEIKTKLTELLGRDYLVRPQVEVTVKDYQSQFVTVLGEVASPGRKPLRGRTRLVDVLVDAGGFGPRASGEVTVNRMDGTFDDGTRTRTLRFAAGSLSADAQAGLETTLRHGDMVSASPKYYVTVEGEVNRPGRFVLENDLTVSGAVSLAGGLTRFGSQGLKLRRLDVATGRTTIVEIDLKDVRNGKQPDPRLLPNDVVMVSRKLI